MARLRLPSTACGALTLLAIYTTLIPAATSVVVSTGAHSPDGNGDLSQFFAPSINAAGQLAFVSNLTGTIGGAADNQAMYRRDPSGLVLVHRTGKSYLGSNTILFFTSSAHLDSSGNAAGVVFVGPPNVVRYFLGNGGPLSPVAAPGSPSPTGNNSLLGITTVGVNDAGLAVFRAVYTGTNTEAGLYTRAANGALATRLLQSTSPPRGGTIGSAGSRPTLNESGQIGTILNINIDSNPIIESVSRVDGTTLYELAREGDVLADGITHIAEVRSEAALINESGKVAFVADYTRPTSIGQGVFLADTSGVTLIAPGLLPGGTSGTNNVQIFGISDSGRVALTTEFIAGGSDPASGVYLAETSGQTIVAFEDTATPVPGKYFRTFHNDWASLNGASQLAFLADLSDTPNGAAAGKGLYFYDPSTGLQQVAHTGEALLGSTITDLFFSGSVPVSPTQSPDTSLSGLNSSGHVAFAFRLANAQEGIAVWSADLPGDFNHNGIVDAADYTVWRDGLGSPYTPADYNTWKAHFGETASGSGSLSPTFDEDPRPVPEPATILLLISLLMLSFTRRFAATSPSRGLRK